VECKDYLDSIENDIFLNNNELWRQIQHISIADADPVTTMEAVRNCEDEDFEIAALALALKMAGSR
jgi:hypothetical protein